MVLEIFIFKRKKKMLELKIFGNENFETVRIVTDKNATPLFCGIDIAKD